MLRVAVKCESHLANGDLVFDPEGNIEGMDSGTTLLRRILSLFDNPILVSSTATEVLKYPWGEVWPVRKIDTNSTVVINMDVMEAFQLYTVLKKTQKFHHPKIVNFAWWNVPEFRDPNLVLGFAASCATFPLFGNSPKVIDDIRVVVNKQMGWRALGQMRHANMLLGIDCDAVSVFRRDSETDPVVQYPAVFANPRKNHELFIEITEMARAMTPFNVRMRLLKSQLTAIDIERFGSQEWVDVTLIPGSKQEYYERMEEETAFVACSKDESYGIGYVEALYAGVVGIFVDKPWVYQIVPDGYPFIFKTKEDGAAMLAFVLQDPERARQMISECAGGNIQQWIREHHNAQAFDVAVVAMVEEFFPSREEKK